MHHINLFKINYLLVFITIYKTKTLRYSFYYVKLLVHKNFYVELTTNKKGNDRLVVLKIQWQ